MAVRACDTRAVVVAVDSALLLVQWDERSFDSFSIELETDELEGADNNNKRDFAAQQRQVRLPAPEPTITIESSRAVPLLLPVLFSN